MFTFQNAIWFLGAIALIVAGFARGIAAETRQFNEMPGLILLGGKIEPEDKIA